MRVRDWLDLAIRGYGVFLLVDAVRTAVHAWIEFVFGDFGFGDSFRATLHSAAGGFLGLLLMTRAEDLLRFMRIGESPAPTGSDPRP